MSRINCVVYAVKTGTSAKTGKDFQYQTVEIVQSPVRPNVLYRRFLNKPEYVLEPGAYTADVHLVARGFDLVPVFSAFERA